MNTLNTPLTIEIWFDFVCPWCWIAKRQLESALSEFEHKDSVTINHYSYRIARGMQPFPMTEALTQKLGSSVNAELMMKFVSNTGKTTDLDYNFNSMLFGDTTAAHTLAIAARKLGLGNAMTERLFSAATTEGRSIFCKAELLKLAREVGINPTKVKSILNDNKLQTKVNDDEAKAHSKGVTGVPFILINGKYPINGAQPAGRIVSVLNDAWKDVKIAKTTRLIQDCNEGICSISE